MWLGLWLGSSPFATVMEVVLKMSKGIKTGSASLPNQLHLQRQLSAESVIKHEAGGVLQQ